MVDPHATRQEQLAEAIFGDLNRCRSFLAISDTDRINAALGRIGAATAELKAELLAVTERERAAVEALRETSRKFTLAEEDARITRCALVAALRNVRATLRGCLSDDVIAGRIDFTTEIDEIDAALAAHGDTPGETCPGLPAHYPGERPDLCYVCAAHGDASKDALETRSEVSYTPEPTADDTAEEATNGD